MVANKYKQVSQAILSILDFGQKVGAARNEIIKIMLQEELLVMSAKSLEHKNLHFASKNLSPLKLLMSL